MDNGDDDAANQLRVEIAAVYRESAVKLRRVAYASLYDAGLQDQADDIVMNAVAEVLEKEPTGIENWEAFLVTVVRRRAVDLMRSASVRRRDGGEHDADLTPSDRTDLVEAEEKVDVLADLARAVDALNQLDGQLHDVAYGFFWQQKTQAQIAQELGISQPRVSQLAAEARKQLQQAIRGGAT